MRNKGGISSAGVGASLETTGVVYLYSRANRGWGRAVLASEAPTVGILGLGAFLP
jgi:hypothetical protein